MELATLVVTRKVARHTVEHWDAGVAKAVEDRIRAFLSSEAHDPLDLRVVVAKFGVLPLIMDMGGCFALRANGEVVSFAWDEPHQLAVVSDERLRNVALCQGSLKYPELAAAVPRRTPDSIDCPSCGGTGTLPIAGKNVANVVCFCGGLGWVPSGSATTQRAQ